jgi:hypothetical protein
MSRVSTIFTKSNINSLLDISININGSSAHILVDKLVISDDASVLALLHCPNTGITGKHTKGIPKNAKANEQDISSRP